MKRIGKFYVPTRMVMDGNVAEVLSYMGFVPIRVEHLAHEQKFEYIGLSHIFEPIEEGFNVPEYTIQIDVHPDHDMYEILVTAHAVNGPDNINQTNAAIDEQIL